MLSLVIGLAVFFGGIFFLHKAGVSEKNIYLLLCGSSYFSLIGSISAMVLAVLALNPTALIVGLVTALLNGFFAHLFAKRGGLIE